MKFIEYSKIYRPKIDVQIQSFIQNQKDRVSSQFLKSFYEGLMEYLLAGGKRIRPLLSIATFNGLSAKEDENMIFPSIAVELLHNASLIHDDIIDKDDLRRGEPAFHYRFRQYHQNHKLRAMQSEEFGFTMGILGGDQVYFLGLDPLVNNTFSHDLNLKATELYKTAFTELCEGVLIEMDMVNRTEVTIDEYIHMISLKTGVLLEKSILIGANYARASNDILPLLSTYAINLGIIFQIKDDILGTFGDEQLTGKPTDGDIREGKKTSLLLAAKMNLKNQDKERLEDLIKKDKKTKGDVIEVKNLFKKANALEFCKNLANIHYQKSLDALKNLETHLNHSEFEFFSDLLEFVYERKF